MKHTTRTTEIKVETEELYLLRKSSVHSMRAWCDACGREVEMVTPERAAEIAGVSTRTIYRWIASGRVHFEEVGAASVMVCEESI